MTQTQTQTQTQLWEQTVAEPLAQSLVDREAGIVRNVKLLGRLSRNRRTYTDRALDEAARLYRSAPLYIDHPTEAELRARHGSRSVMDLAGEVMGARRVGDEVRGDLHLLAREPHRGLILALAEQMPRKAGLSHRATALLRPTDDGDVVEGIISVEAVELVTDPATTAGLFESIAYSQGERIMTSLKELTLDQLQAERPDLVTAAVAEAVGKMTKELDDARQALRAFEDEAAARARAELVEKLLAEAKLPAAAITDTFREMLVAAKDETAIRALIADRAAVLAAAAGPRPVSLERSWEHLAAPHATRTLDNATIVEWAKRIGVVTETT